MNTTDSNQQNITEQVKHILEEKGVKASFQRLSIMRFLLEEKNHPSVDMIYKNLVQIIPTLSKTTVYNTLGLLAEKGVITALNINHKEMYYDYMKIPHAHFYCLTCRKVYDLEVKSGIFSVKFLYGHKVKETQVILKGYCSYCQQLTIN